VAPHCEQTLAVGEFFVPQTGHSMAFSAWGSSAPHSTQLISPGLFILLHCGHLFDFIMDVSGLKHMTGPLKSMFACYGQLSERQKGACLKRPPAAWR
jgi:hypothetical protein